MPSNQSSGSGGNYGFADMHTRMDRHIAREARRQKPRMTNDPRDSKGKFANANHAEVTKGRRVKRKQPYELPYGGRPNETIKKPARDKKRWKHTVSGQVDQIGARVARESSSARPGCTVIMIDAAQAKAMMVKLQSAVRAGLVSDTLPTESDSKLYNTRIQLVIEQLRHSQHTGTRVAIAVFARAELQAIGSQRIKAKHITPATRALDAKLKTSTRNRNGR